MTKEIYEAIDKPAAFIKYNAYMGGIDLADMQLNFRDFLDRTTLSTYK